MQRLRIKQNNAQSFYPQQIMPRSWLSASNKSRCFLRKSSLHPQNSFDCNNRREHDERGSKRFEEQQVIRTVANLER